MAWGPEKAAGFALAALVSDDRELHRVRRVLAEDALPALEAQLALAHAGEGGVRTLLSQVRPEIGGEARVLPMRMRALLARLLPAPLRKQLLEDAAPARPDFSPDERLLAALARIARCAQVRSAP